jgi:hypothetical protein
VKPLMFAMKAVTLVMKALMLTVKPVMVAMTAPLDHAGSENARGLSPEGKRCQGRWPVHPSLHPSLSYCAPCAPPVSGWVQALRPFKPQWSGWVGEGRRPP